MFSISHTQPGEKKNTQRILRIVVLIIIQKDNLRIKNKENGNVYN